MPIPKALVGDDRPNPLLHEGILHFLAPAVIESRVIGSRRDLVALEQIGDALDGLSRRCVDDRQTLALPEEPDE